jgi:hypothetical protein
MATKILRRSLLPSVSLGLGVLAGASIAVMGLSTTALAQIGTPQPLADFQDKDNPDPFSSRGGGQADSMFNLIHRAIQGPTKSVDEFNSEQRESLDSAAEEFRARQAELLRGNPTASPAPAPVITLPPTN